jgi:hypothetical protein
MGVSDMGIEHQGDVNDQVEGPGSGSDSPNVEQPELADIQQLNKAGGSAQADSVLRSANLELVDDSSEPVMR